jgi:hypothetical protein
MLLFSIMVNLWSCFTVCFWLKFRKTDVCNIGAHCNLIFLGLFTTWSVFIIALIFMFTFSLSLCLFLSHIFSAYKNYLQLQMAIIDGWYRRKEADMGWCSKSGMLYGEFAGYSEKLHVLAVALWKLKHIYGKQFYRLYIYMPCPPTRAHYLMLHFYFQIPLSWSQPVIWLLKNMFVNIPSYFCRWKYFNYAHLHYSPFAKNGSVTQISVYSHFRVEDW